MIFFISKPFWKARNENIIINTTTINTYFITSNHPFWFEFFPIIKPPIKNDTIGINIFRMVVIFPFNILKKLKIATIIVKIKIDINVVAVETAIFLK